MLILSFGIGVGAYFLFVTERALQNAVGQTSVFLAEDLMERIDKDIFDKVEQIQLYTKDNALQVALQESNSSFAELADASEYIATKDQEWRAADQQMSQSLIQDLIDEDLSETLRQEFLEFWQQKYGFPVYGEAFITNAFGANVAQTGRTSDYYQADEEWWQQAREKEFFVADMEYDESAQAWTMPLSVRIEDSKGTFLGVIKAIPLAQELFRQAELTGKRYQTTAMKVLTKDGHLVYSTLPFEIFEDLSQEEFYRQTKSGKGFFIGMEEDTRRLFAYTQSKGFNDFLGLGWIVLISHDTKEVFASVQALKRSIIFTGIGLLVLILILAFILIRTISLPLRKLTRAVRYIGKGNFKTRIRIKSKDEIGQLASAFNKMTGRLQDSYEDLEGKVVQRTAQLEERIKELDATAKMLIKRDLDLTEARTRMQDQIKEMDKVAKLLVRRDFEFMQANEFLREMDEAKSRFVSIAAHQLRTPLSGVTWTMQMLLSGDFGKLSKDQKEVLQEAYSTLQHLVALVRDLLSVARIEEGRTKFSLATVSVQDICTRVFKESAIAAESKKIDLKLSLPKKSLPNVRGDATNLMMAVHNIVDNAIIYTRKEGSVEIGAKKHEDRVMIFVKDTGVGIPEDQRLLIGQKFFRADNVVKERVHGNGLGLYIVKKILEHHSTNLEFTSEEGKGSTFFFTLPFSE